MKIFCLQLMVASIVFPALNALAVVRHVDVNGNNPTPPYTNWASAAVTIQDAIDAADPGDLVLVTNGVYQTGGRIVYGYTRNRVALTKALTVRSVNGPELTIISGYSGTLNPPARCAYLTDGAELVGFTLTGGGARSTGDYSGEQSGGGAWCESTAATLSNCVITGNAARSGSAGGIYSGTLNNCVVRSNSAYSGGGVVYSSAYKSILTANYSLADGAGAFSATLSNCILTNNHSGFTGGGAAYSTLNNCFVSGNTAQYQGGGAYRSTLNNCTVIGNSASTTGGGIAALGVARNCIVYLNTAPTGPNYDDSSTLYYSCTAPLPTGGFGNISVDPQLASLSHLSAESPCRGTGNPGYAAGDDIDGDSWKFPPSIGCDEYVASSLTGALSVAFQPDFTNVNTGFGVNVLAMIEGRTGASRWNFGDGTIVSNQPSTKHSWAAPGDYTVELRAYNESHPTGVAATVTVHVVNSVHYVATDSSDPQSPYLSWATAATNIQAAVDVAFAGSTVLVSNGVYAAGHQGKDGKNNRVAVTMPLTLKSVHGPAATVIEGYQSPGTTNDADLVRCVYLTNGATLIGFTLTNGATAGSGGGLYCESTNAFALDCIITRNSAGNGGAAYNGTLSNCVVVGNATVGAFGSTLHACLITRIRVASPTVR